MNSFWDPPISAGDKSCLHFHFHLNQQCALEANLLTSFASFHAGRGAGPALGCAGWAGSSGTASEAALPAGSSAHSPALALGNSCAYSWESWQNWACLPSKALLCLLWTELSPGEPSRGRGQLWTSLSRCCTERQGRTRTLPQSLQQCCRDSTATSGTDTHRLLQAMPLQTSPLLDGTGLL